MEWLEINTLKLRTYNEECHGLFNELNLPKLSYLRCLAPVKDYIVLFFIWDNICVQDQEKYKLWVLSTEALYRLCGSLFKNGIIENSHFWSLWYGSKLLCRVLSISKKSSHLGYSRCKALKRVYSRLRMVKLSSQCALLKLMYKHSL